VLNQEVTDRPSAILGHLLGGKLVRWETTFHLPAYTIELGDGGPLRPCPEDFLALQGHDEKPLIILVQVKLSGQKGQSYHFFLRTMAAS